MKLRKLFINFLLLILLVFSSIFLNISYAGDFNNNAGGGSSSESSGNGLGGNATKTLYSDTSGYRITLIDPVTGEVKSKSIDILFSVPSGPFAQYTTSRVEESGANNNYNYFLNTQIESMLSSAGYPNASIPRWFNRNGKVFSGESTTFRDWFCPESATDALSGLRQAIGEYTDAIKKLDEQLSNPYNNYITVRMSNTMEGTSKLYTLYQTASGYIRDKNNLYSREICREAFDLYYYAVINEETYNVVGPGVNAVLLKSLWDDLVKKYPEEASNNPYLASINKNNLLSLTSFASNSISDDSNDSEKGVNGISDLYTDGIHFNVSKYGWALGILFLEQNGVGIFAPNGESGKTMVQMFLDGEAYICVEPVLFFKPQTTKNYPYTFWGTAKNYADFSVSALAAWDEVALSQETINALSGLFDFGSAPNVENTQHVENGQVTSVGNTNQASPLQNASQATNSGEEVTDIASLLNGGIADETSGWNAEAQALAEQLKDALCR